VPALVLEAPGRAERTIERRDVGIPRLLPLQGKWPGVRGFQDGGHCPQRQHADAVARGAKLLGTGRRDRETLTVEPAVLLDVPADAEIMREEIFGPVLPVIAYDALDDVINQVGSRPKPLAIYAYTDRATSDALLAGTSSGGATLHGWATHCAEIRLPFGGVNHSGTGAYHGVHGFRELSHARGVVEHVG